MLDAVRKLLGRMRSNADSPVVNAQSLARPRYVVDDVDYPIFAVGDVHGRLDLLKALERKISANVDRLGDRGALVVMLGDYIDRGPKSAAVLDHLQTPIAPNLTRLCLAGNHEAMFLEFLASPSPRSAWLQNGGYETLKSYGVPPETVFEASRRPQGLAELLGAVVPDEHIEFMRAMPALLDSPNYIFVHGGVAAGVPLAMQTETDLLWMRPPADKDDKTLIEGKTIVHGHTQVGMPFVGRSRINLDTGAFRTGVLTAIRLVPGERPRLIQASATD